MNENICRIQINGKDCEYPYGTLYEVIARDVQADYEDTIVLAVFDCRLRELSKQLHRNGELSFVTTAQKDGRSTYRRSVTFLMLAAAHAVRPEYNIVVQHSIGQGYYCEIYDNDRNPVLPDEAFLAALEEKMTQLCEADLPIRKYNVETRDAIRLFGGMNMPDKQKLIRYRRSSRINIYGLSEPAAPEEESACGGIAPAEGGSGPDQDTPAKDCPVSADDREILPPGYYEYFYGFMVPSTGYLESFALEGYQEGFMLLFPGKDTHRTAEFQPSDKLFHILKDSSNWGESLGVATIGELNDTIAAGKIQDLILIQEAAMEQKIGRLAEDIAARKKCKFVMVAGPSSSGKTTFSHRLSIQLRAQGLTPHPVGLDDFYVNREDTPRDESGDYDFECLEAIDIELFNDIMRDLMEGCERQMPTFNFKTGKREFRGNTLKLGDDDILVIEGIHGLNGSLSYLLPDESKFKIYISALTQLNIDEHNNLPTTDGRLIRRLVRDARTRNTDAQSTLARWASVRRGEEKNIFPFQEQADVMFNSALIYELAVLKLYAEPLLFRIRPDCGEYPEAKRLLKFLDYVLPVPSENINTNSILREFIGGGCFNM